MSKEDALAIRFYSIDLCLNILKFPGLLTESRSRQWESCAEADAADASSTL